MDAKILRKVRTEYGKKIRKEYESHTIYEKRANMTEYEPRTDGIANSLTTVTKDNLLLVGIRQATQKGYIECRGGGYSMVLILRRNSEEEEYRAEEIYRQH